MRMVSPIKGFQLAMNLLHLHTCLKQVWVSKGMNNFKGDEFVRVSLSLIDAHTCKDEAMLEFVYWIWTCPNQIHWTWIFILLIPSLKSYSNKPEASGSVLKTTVSKSNLKKRSSARSAYLVLDYFRIANLEYNNFWLIVIQSIVFIASIWNLFPLKSFSTLHHSGHGDGKIYRFQSKWVRLTITS